MRVAMRVEPAMERAKGITHAKRAVVVITDWVARCAVLK